jgi:hypothetical protein
MIQPSRALLDIYPHIPYIQTSKMRKGGISDPPQYKIKFAIWTRWTIRTLFKNDPISFGVSPGCTGCGLKRA